MNSKPNLNVRAVTFESGLTWNDNVSKTVSKTNKALYRVKQIKQYCSPKELGQLIFITSNVYSILYYNSEICGVAVV